MSTLCHCVPTHERTVFASISCTLLLLTFTAARGQFTTAINSPPKTTGNPESIGSNTQLNVSDGGSVGLLFSAGARDVLSENREVNISGGSVGPLFDAHAGSRVTISDGAVGWACRAQNGSRVTVTGGSVGDGLSAFYGSQVTISGGSAGNDFDFLESTVVSRGRNKEEINDESELRGPVRLSVS